MTKHFFSAIISVLLAAATASAQRYAVIDFSVAHLQADPDYESALETEELMGSVVEILEENGYWRKVLTDQPYTAWVNEMALVEMGPESLAEYHSARKYICIAPASTVYSEPSLKSVPVSDLVMGDVLRIVWKKPGKAEVTKKFAHVLLPSGKDGFVPAKDLRDYSGWKDSCEATPDNVVATALRFKGIPYLWGGASTKGFDCSGLVRFAFMMNGMKLPRNASEQALLGREIPFESLEKGDLLFFGTPSGLLRKEKVTHVGLYIGGGKMIHASQVVRVNSVNPEDPDAYENMSKFLRAKRLF